MWTVAMLVGVLLLLYVESAVSVQLDVTKSSSYAKLIGNIAALYNSKCIYLLNDFSEEGIDDKVFLYQGDMYQIEHLDEISLNSLAKAVAISQRLPTNVYSFDDYHNLTFGNRITRCYLPLHVVISFDNMTRLQFAEHSHVGGLQGSVSSGGGVWLVFLESTEEQFLQMYFDGINTPFDSEIIVATLDIGKNMELKEVYRVGQTTPLRSPLLALWSEQEGLKQRNSQKLYRRRDDLEGIEFNTVYIRNPPFVIPEKTTDGRLKLGGYLGEIWQVLEETLNFTSKLQSTDFYGRRAANGSWTGLVYDLQVGKYDVSIADLAISNSRAAVIGYTIPLLLSRFEVYYQSKGVALDADALFSPLGNDMWIALLCWLCVGSIGLVVGCIVSDKFFGTKDRYSLEDAFFFVAGALCAQGGENVPERYGCRLLYVSTFFITAVVFPAYSASLMSFLAVSTPHVPFTDLKQFYEQTTMTMILKASGFEYDMFAYASDGDPYMKKIYERDIEPYPEDFAPKTDREGVQKLCADRNLAYVSTSDAVTGVLVRAQKEGKKWVCPISHMPRELATVAMGFGFPKYSPYLGIVNYRLRHFPSRGLFARLRKKHWSIERPTNGDDYVPVGINNIFMVFVIIGAGLLVSLMLFAYELYNTATISTKHHAKVDFILRRKILYGGSVLYYY